MGYFADLMASSDEIGDSIQPLLKLCREHIDRSNRLDTALLRSLERDPLLTERQSDQTNYTLSTARTGISCFSLDM